MIPQYLFYDLETSGTNHAFDQIYQFGAILTDDKFNELERYEINIKQRPDVICHPMAMKTTLLSVSDIQKGVPEYEGITQIHKLMNKPNTISIGYNTLSFDDKMLRFAFFRNLLPAYTHQFNNGCYRADILPVTLLFFLFKGEVLKWSKVDDKISLKLENINAANNLYVGQAHNALVDTIVTLKLTKQFYQYNDVLNYFLGYFNKDTDFRRTRTALKNSKGIFDSNLPIVSLANVKYGAVNGFSIPALFIGSLDDKKSATFLRLDNDKLQDITKENIQESTWFINKKYGDNIIVLPDDSRSWETYSSDVVNLVNHNLQIIKNTPNLLDDIKKHHSQSVFQYPAHYDLDSKLYETPYFAFDKDKQAISEFHNAPLESKLDVINKFKESTFKRLANRLILRNYPQQASPELKSSFSKYLKESQQFNIPRDYKGEPKLTKSKALAEIERIFKEESPNQAQIDVLLDYKKHLQK